MFTCSSCTEEKIKSRIKTIKNKYQVSDNTNFVYDADTYSTPASILLGLTNDCNLNCSYCFVKQNKKYMTYETAEKSILWVLKNAEKKDYKPIVTFFGGEPLLLYDEIIVPIVEKYKDKVEFSITTNGLLLDEDKVDFFYRNNVGILLSFDGVKQVQNEQRPAKDEVDSYETILSNIPYLILRKPETTMRVTVTKKSIPYLYETLLMAENLGFKKIHFCPNAFEDWSFEEEGKILEEQFKKIGLHIFNSFFNKNDISIRVEPLIKTFNNIENSLTNNLHYNNSLFRCGLGTTSCGITPDGDIVPCQEKTSNPTYIIGNIIKDNGINGKQHEEFLKWYIEKMEENTFCSRSCSDKQCLHCLSNMCPSRLEDLDFNLSSSDCIFLTYLLREANRLYILCNHSINPIISSYFEGGQYE